jgi:DNA ligase D-like protein (predicted ligase)
VVAIAADGRPSFHRLQHRMHDRAPSAASRRTIPASALVFDALAIGGRDLRGRPLLERKALLRRLLRRPGVLRYVDHVHGPGRDFLAALAARNLEGLVAKRAQSRYVAGRSRDWIKVKCTRTGTFVIGGYTVPQGTRAHLGALHLGQRDGRELAYVGRVGSGLDDAMLARLGERLAKLAAPRPPFTSGDPPLGAEHHWVRPRLVCTVRFTEWTDDGRLRHPVFLGLA